MAGLGAACGVGEGGVVGCQGGLEARASVRLLEQRQGSCPIKVLSSLCMWPLVSLFRPKHWLVNTSDHKLSHCSEDGQEEMDPKYHTVHER